MTSVLICWLFTFVCQILVAIFRSASVFKGVLGGNPLSVLLQVQEVFEDLFYTIDDTGLWQVMNDMSPTGAPKLCSDANYATFHSASMPTACLRDLAPMCHSEFIGLR